ncbi:MAG: DUF934 domain-containing protein [Pseudomonadota bacterium]
MVLICLPQTRPAKPGSHSGGNLAGGNLTIQGTSSDEFLPLPRLGELEPACAAITQLAIHPDDDLACLATMIRHLHLIAVLFESFADGRGFSLGQIIRRDLGYLGELRARGHLIPDQYPMALACGFDVVEITAEQFARQPLEQWQQAWQATPADLRTRQRQSR